VVLQIPERLGGRYRLEQSIGTGGMGRVYRAHDELLDRPVAVKLLDEAASDPARMAEARAAASVSHPGIVHVFDVGLEGETGYIVMELASGSTLRDVLRDRGPLEPLEAAELAAQVADALEAIHRHGMVHCDVKSLNVILTESGHTKLVDFGIARAAASERSGDEEIRGSVAYVAPEQARGEALDGRTDVYALGAVLYEMLTGRTPFSGATTAEVVAQRLVSEPPPPRRFDEAIPAEIESIALRALARNPAERYASAAEMRDALRAFVARSGDAAFAPTQPMPVLEPIHSRLRSRVPHLDRRALALIGVCVVLLGAATGWRLTHPPIRTVPMLVGRSQSELPQVLEDAGISMSQTTVLTRPVQPEYVGRIVDQQPQPGLPLDADGLQIAVGVPESDD
jgi:serine/threonine-protein kinase